MLFIGNVFGAELGQRRLDGQPDYNRIWRSTDSPEAILAQEVLAQVRARRPFAGIDVHNNTGRNPHYACVSRWEAAPIRLAEIFGRTVVHAPQPTGTLCHSLSDFMPSVTLECGRPGEPRGTEHASQFLHSCLHLAELPMHALNPRDIDAYKTHARLCVAPDIRFALDTDPDAGQADVVFFAEMDKWNFSPLPAGTVIARKRVGRDVLIVESEDGTPLPLLDQTGEMVRLREDCVPSMLTPLKTIIEQDCLGYLMRPIPLPK